MSVTAIHDVTAALRALIKADLIDTQRSGFSNADVTLQPPGDQLTTNLGINLYLYRVEQNPQFRNMAWRGDRSHQPADRIPLALNLSYLVTPTAQMTDGVVSDLGHTMLGIAMNVLHQNPLLTSVHTPQFDASAELPQYLRDSYEPIVIALLPTSIDELSKIWATINQPYRLSVAYEVSLVEIIEPARALARSQVLSTGIDVEQILTPSISTLTPASGALATLVGVAVTPRTVLVNGTGMTGKGAAPHVGFGGAAARIVTTTTAPDTITVEAPADVPEGPGASVTVRVRGGVSAPARFDVTPWLVSVLPLRSALDGPTTLALAGRGLGGPGARVRFETPGGAPVLPAVTAGNTANAAHVVVPAGLVNGVYDVRFVTGGDDVSNGRRFEVVPRIANVTAAVVAGAHVVTITGARLQGASITVTADGTVHAIAPGSAGDDDTTLHANLHTMLAAGPHVIDVVVEGHRSPTFTLTI